MNEDFDPWARAANNMAAALMQMPMMRAQARDNASRQAYYDANAQESVARAGYYNKRAAAPDSMGNGLAAVFKAMNMPESPERQTLLERGVRDLGIGMAENPREAVDGLGRTMMLLQAAGSKDSVERFANFSGKPVGDAVNQAGWDTRFKVPIEMNDNATLVDRSGKVLNPGVHRLGIGDRLFAGTPESDIGLVPVGVPLPPGGLTQVAEGMPPAARPPTLDPGGRAKLQAYSGALGELLKANPNDPAVTNLLRSIDAIAGGARPPAAPAGPVIIRMVRDQTGRLVPTQ